jgi:hypothetical protein
MAAIIASGTTQAESADIVRAAGADPATLAIVANVGTATVGMVALIQKKGSDNAWYTVGELNRNTPALELTGTGTFRVQRQATSVAFAVDQD